MIVAYLCICKFKKHYNLRYIQKYQLSKINLWCYGIARKMCVSGLSVSGTYLDADFKVFLDTV